MATLTFKQVRENYERTKATRDSMLDAVKELRGRRHGDSLAEMEKDERPSVRMLLESYLGFDAELDHIDQFYVEPLPRDHEIGGRAI